MTIRAHPLVAVALRCALLLTLILTLLAARFNGSLMSYRLGSAPIGIDDAPTVVLENP